MKFFIRLMTGIVYILVIAGFIILRRVHVAFFDGLLVIFALLGYLEMSRAFGERTDQPQKVIGGIFAVGAVVCYALCDTLISAYAPQLTLAVLAGGVALLIGLLVFRHEQTTLEGVGISLLTMLYPSLFLLVLSAINHAPMFSEIGIVFVFAICPFADCFAYVFGILLGKKFPKKMSPTVSPNKTVVGGMGGMIGGAVGALAVFFLYYGLVSTELAINPVNVIIFLGVGLVTALFSMVGDLAESAIKRKIGIKDMGKLLPGHGGVLDRIDSSLYAGLFVGLVILIARMIVL